MIDPANLISYVLADAEKHHAKPPYFALASSAFKENQAIPRIYTCKGKNLSIPLSWHHTPRNTKSFALVMFDPDAIGGTWFHWGVYNIPANISEIKAGQPINGASTVKNSWNKTAYSGPCPLSGTHRYVFRLFALNRQLKVNGMINTPQLEMLIKPYVIQSTELVGTYSNH